MTNQKPEIKEYSRFEFPGNSSTGRCFIRAWVWADRLVVLCTQLIDYQGTSVTNAVQDLAPKVIEQLDADIGLEHYLPPKSWLRFWESRNVSFFDVMPKMHWIEHYPPGVGLNPQGSYQLVRFVQGDWHWTTISLSQAAELAGVPEQSLIIDPKLLT